MVMINSPSEAMWGVMCVMGKVKKKQASSAVQCEAPSVTWREGEKKKLERLWSYRCYVRNESPHANLDPMKENYLDQKHKNSENPKIN